MSEPRTSLSIDEAFDEAMFAERVGFDGEPVKVANRYELLRKIGRGGQGTVYEAYDPELDRKVAIKVLPLGDPSDARREGHALAKLHHRNVVAVYESGHAEDYRFFVLQLLTGPTLRDWCADKSPEDIVSKYVEAARGLEAAHAKGLVHRDFKPSNVRIGEDRQAVVVDFGLARNLQSVDGDSDERGVVVGTLAYTAPERLIGQVADERSDQFSFCVSLWEALAGCNPYGHVSEETTAAERFLSIQVGLRGSPRGPRHVRSALERGLSISPAGRFRSIAELIEALGQRPPPRRGLLKVVVLASLVSLMGFSMMDDGHPQSLGWVTAQSVRVKAASAVAAAVAGDGRAALTFLDDAQRPELLPEHAHTLAVAAQDVARELGAQGMDADAGDAWVVSIVLARLAGDETLAEQGRQGLSDHLASIPLRPRSK